MNKIIFGASVLLISGAVMLSACSMNLGPETLPSTVVTTETTETEPTETSATIRPELTDPFSVALVTESVVEKNGQLSIKGKSLLNSKGEEVVLKGMTSYGIHDCVDFFNSDIIRTLAEDWGSDVLRIAITGDGADSAFMKDPDKYFDPICKICDMCISQGIYVIIDWDIHYDEAATENSKAAVDFFTRLSAIYATSPNIIYGVSNYDATPEEGVKDEWTKLIAPFASDVITAIRTNSPEAIVIVGAPNNGLDVDTIGKAKLKYDNVAYGCRLFSGNQKQEQRDKIKTAIDSGLCVFITEWGLTMNDSKGGVCYLESDRWSQFFEENKISWCNYGIGSFINNDSNALMLLSGKYNNDQKASHWPDGLISKSGLYAREQILKGKVASETSATESSAETT